MTIPTITAYCLNWHLENSPAFQALLVNPLKPWADIRLTTEDDVAKLDQPKGGSSDKPIIFCQIAPPRALSEHPNARLVWIPMWDQARHLPDERWAAMPKSLRVVAFSQAVAEKAEAAGLPTLRLQYFKNPADFPIARWDQSRVLFYWNRIGAYRRDFLKRMCRELDIDTLILRDTLDPRISNDGILNLPTKLGKTKVRQIGHIKTHDDYINLLSAANIYLAPRLYEGVGMAFMEALATGCAVFSYNAPTANEYIQHGITGYLLRNTPIHWSARRVAFGVRRRLVPLGVKKAEFEDSLVDCQNWSQISSLNLQGMGEKARSAHFVGYERWQPLMNDYAHFVLDW